jgi:TonB family protein
LLDEAAAQAGRNWRFEPAHIGKTPTASQVEVPIRFKIAF